MSPHDPLLPDWSYALPRWLDPQREEQPLDIPNTPAASLLALTAKLGRSGPQVDPTTLPAAEGRALVAQRAQIWNTDLPPMQRREYVVPPARAHAAPCRVVVVTPENAASGAILMIPGGGFAFGAPETDEHAGRCLAQAARMSVVLPDYRKAPEDPFPAGLHDVASVYLTLARHPAAIGCTAGPILVGGDSAGANLAIATLLLEQQRSAAGLLLYYGMFAPGQQRASHLRFAEFPGFTSEKLGRYTDWYLPDPTRRTDPLAAPLLADDTALSALPPVHILAAALDPLLSDSLALWRRLAGLGHRVRLDVAPGMPHGFLQMSQHLQDARQALILCGHVARGFASAL